MLVVARKVGQTLLIGEEIEVTVAAIRGDQVRLAIKAPRSISIHRRDAIEQVGQSNVAAADAVESVLRLVAPSTAASEPASAPLRPVVPRPQPPSS